MVKKEPHNYPLNINFLNFAKQQQINWKESFNMIFSLHSSFVGWLLQGGGEGCWEAAIKNEFNFSSPN